MNRVQVHLIIGKTLVMDFCAHSDFLKLGCFWDLLIGETRCIVFDLKRYGK